MILVSVLRGPDGSLRGFEADGHAGYARRHQSDIVCAGISVLAATAVGALKDLAGVEPSWTERDGYMECRIPAPEEDPRGDSAAARTILETFVLGCRQVEASYGEQYVHVTDMAPTQEVNKR